MKKIFYCLIFSMIFIFTGCTKGNLSTYHEISYKEYVSMVENNESFPLVIGSSTCSTCSMFKPTMESFISKYQVDVRYIDLSKLSEDEKNKLGSDLNFQSTPTTIFFENGKQTSVYYRIVGSESLNGVVSAYKRMGYIKG